MKWLKRTMELFISFFIIVTGVMILPQIPEAVPKWVTFIYACSIVFSSSYFSWLGISEEFLKLNNKKGGKKHE